MDLTRTKYNNTYSMLRLESNGSLNVHTYYQHETEYLELWEVSYKFFDNTQCALPEKCEKLGVYEND